MREVIDEKLVRRLSESLCRRGCLSCDQRCIAPERAGQLFGHQVRAVLGAITNEGLVVGKWSDERVETDLDVEPKIEGGIPVVHHVAVNERNELLHGGPDGVPIGDIADAGWIPGGFVVHRIEAAVPRFAGPLTVRGRVVEANDG